MSIVSHQGTAPNPSLFTARTERLVYKSRQQKFPGITMWENDLFFESESKERTVTNRMMKGNAN